MIASTRATRTVCALFAEAAFAFDLHKLIEIVTVVCMLAVGVIGVINSLCDPVSAAWPFTNGHRGELEAVYVGGVREGATGRIQTANGEVAECKGDEWCCARGAPESSLGSVMRGDRSYIASVIEPTSSLDPPTKARAGRNLTSHCMEHRDNFGTCERLCYARSRFYPC